MDDRCSAEERGGGVGRECGGDLKNSSDSGKYLSHWGLTFRD